MNGYSIYVSKSGGRWTVRVYRNADGEHVHSWERMESLTSCFDSVARKIEEDQRS